MSSLLDLIFNLGLILICLGLGLLFFAKILENYIPDIRGYIGEVRVRRIIEDLGYPAIHGYYATDADGVPTQIDHLIKVPGGIIVLETKNFSGKLYGRRHQKRWTYFLGPLRMTIQNPIHQNHRHVATMSGNFPGVEFLNLVCFAGGRFPRGIPSGVTTPATLPSILRSLHEATLEYSAVTEDAWDFISRAAKLQNNTHRRAHLQSLRNRFPRKT